MKFLYVTDLHGDQTKYEKTMKLAIDKGIHLIVNGGDMLPKVGNRFIEQPLFIRGFLREHFAKLQEHSITYLAMLGNDDLVAVDDLFNEACNEFNNVYNMANTYVTVDGYDFIGMNQIQDHPFVCKDRGVVEKAYVRQQQLCSVALLSEKNGYCEIPDWFNYATTKLQQMRSILNDLPQPKDPEKATYIMHMPPAGLRLGQLLFQDLDIGSVDIYEFLKEKQPALFLHGHIHECPDTAKGQWKNHIGRTICVQPGQTELYDDYMVYVEVDLDENVIERKFEQTHRIVVTRQL